MEASLMYLSTRDVARLLNVKYTSSVIGLISRGLLACERRITTRGHRTRYLVTFAEVEAYACRHDPAILPRLRRAASYLEQTRA
jgi:hypothetical protein